MAVFTEHKEDMVCHQSKVQHRLCRCRTASGKSTGVIRDERISFTGPLTKDKYPRDLRLIRFFDEERQKALTFLTNNFRLAATTIAKIYKSRWQIELFFKWIKQNLKIKSFLGASKNAVLTQIWVAMCYYLLLTYIKYQTKYSYSLLHLSRIIRETFLTEKALLIFLPHILSVCLLREMRCCRGLYFNRTVMIE